MVPSIVRLVAGLALTEVVTTRLGLVIILAGQKWVVMTSYDLILAGANKLWSCGNYICIQLPLRVLSAYWKAQVFLLTLPYRCVQRLLRILRSSISGLVDPPIRATTQEILREFLNKECSERDGVMKSIQEIREHSLAAIQRMETFNQELHRCRNKVQDWKTETERRTNAITSFGREERKLRRVVIAAIKHLRRHKRSKAVIDDQFKHTLECLVNFSRSLSQKRDELNDSVEGSPGMVNGNLKSAYNRLQKQADLLGEYTAKRRKALYHASLAPSEALPPLRGINEFINTSSPKQALVTDSELVSIGMETLQSIVYILNAENLLLKTRLEHTNDQLGDVKTTTKSLSDKVTELEMHLDRVKEVLKLTEEERDEMCCKLLALSEIIEQQEEYLNDSSHEDSFSSSYHTAPDIILNESCGAVAASARSDCSLL